MYRQVVKGGEPDGETVIAKNREGPVRRVAASLAPSFLCLRPAMGQHDPLPNVLVDPVNSRDLGCNLLANVGSDSHENHELLAWIDTSRAARGEDKSLHRLAVRADVAERTNVSGDHDS